MAKWTYDLQKTERINFGMFETHVHFTFTCIFCAPAGADLGGGVLGVRTPTFGGPPNFIKREKTSLVRAKTPHFST